MRYTYRIHFINGKCVDIKSNYELGTIHRGLNDSRKFDTFNETHIFQKEFILFVEKIVEDSHG